MNKLSVIRCWYTEDWHVQVHVGSQVLVRGVLASVANKNAATTCMKIKLLNIQDGIYYSSCSAIEYSCLSVCQSLCLSLRLFVGLCVCLCTRLLKK